LLFLKFRPELPLLYEQRKAVNEARQNP